MNSTDTVGWIITGVHTDDDKRRIGYGMGHEEGRQTQSSYNAAIGRTLYLRTGLTADMIPADKRVKWRSFSDDGDPAYDGVVHIDWLYAPAEWPDEDSDLAYLVDKFNMEDWGAVIVLYNAADIRRCRPDLAEYVARHPRMEGKDFLRESKIDTAAWLPIYS